MNSNFVDGFADELVKEAKYPISRILTNRGVSAGVGAAEGGAQGTMHLFMQALQGSKGGAAAAVIGSGAGIPLTAGAYAGMRALEQHVMRSVGGRALHGRLVKGGKGLMGHEKKKIGEALGVSGPKLEKMIASYAAANKGAKTNPISRAVSTKYTGIGALRRMLDTRAMAGRAAAGGVGMTGKEKAILAELGVHGKSMDSKRKLRMLMGGAGLGSGLGAGAAIGSSRRE